MKVYNYDLKGYLTGVAELDDSDKCQITGDWLIPAMATEKEPLQAKEGYEVKFDGKEWEYIKLVTEEEKKIQGLVPLEDGEIIQDNKLIKLEKPSDLHSWNGTEWYLDEEKIRIAKLPNQEDILNAKIELKALELLSQLELI